jgi:2,4-dienoyl-CoA reductase-like NADH-dependent reductase (Old Yellow Enzyme family)
MSSRPADALFTPYTLGDLQLKNRIACCSKRSRRCWKSGRVIASA